MGAYYGNAGEWTFVAAALLFTAVTLLYSMKGGLRTSIFTDVIQAVLFVVAISVVLFVIVAGFLIPVAWQRVRRPD